MTEQELREWAESHPATAQAKAVLALLKDRNRCRFAVREAVVTISRLVAVLEAINAGMTREEIEKVLAENPGEMIRVDAAPAPDAAAFDGTYPVAAGRTAVLSKEGNVGGGGP